MNSPRTYSGRILVLNGVNLGRLGRRRLEVYGGLTLDDIRSELQETFPGTGIDLRQTDHEGEMVAWIHAAAPDGEEGYDGLIINPGAWTHYAYALHDALEMVEMPKVEVHLSNVHAREGWRRESVISPSVDAVIAGMGAFGYRAAVSYVLSRDHAPEPR
ncbi:type II 3-dehydroquinate dehydratase [Rubrobacter aplysinae]|uniref:type II 3-dehydroquinate dehydratase n=1 Tax=Rubrobacter aplysinae TaxID=909625 RepID=UPI00064BCD6C|nr:type II 3-dehydroquinate dehydratase [Rubrobacter aplysinae]